MGTQGVIFLQGSRFGRYSLFVRGGKLTYVYNFLGIPPEQKVVADAPTSGTHIGFDVADDPYVDVERELAAAMARN
jgi:hypothetical protein